MELGFVLFLLVSVSSLDFFMFSDLHYDLNYVASASSSSHCHGDPSRDTEKSAKFGCDSSAELIRSALAKAKSANADPDFIVLAGDVLSHFSEALTAQEILSSFSEVAEMFKEAFPRSQLLMALGNNDGFEDYVLPSANSQPLNEYLAQAFGPLTGELPNSFISHGYYSIPTRTGHQAIVLNTNFFSIRVEHDFESASQHLSWLDSQLQSLSPDQPAILIMHIPPGPGMFKGNSYDWHSCFIDQFISIVTTHESKISLMLAGHQHKSGLQLIPRSTLGVLVTQSISPIFRNNPGFRRYEVTETKADYKDYFLDLWQEEMKWEEKFSFEEFFGEMEKFDYQGMYELLATENSTYLFDFLSHAHGFSSSPIDPSEVWKVAVSLDSEPLMHRTALCAYKFIRNFDFELCKWGINSVA